MIYITICTAIASAHEIGYELNNISQLLRNLNTQNIQTTLKTQFEKIFIYIGVTE